MISLRFYIEENIGFIEFDQKDSKVNILTADTLKEFDSILDEVKNQSFLQALFILSSKKDIFIAGADIKEIEKITDQREAEAKSKSGQEIFNKLEDLKIPTIAVIDGVALGGGCELALACQYRVATFNSKIRIGVPEVNLGILPGFGGTYRLPRMVGLEQGLKLILSGKPIDASQALKIGLVDKLVPPLGLRENLKELLAELKISGLSLDKYRRRKRTDIQKLLEESLLIQSFIFSQAKKSVLESTRGSYPAPLKIIQLVKENFYSNRNQGLNLEAKAFSELVTTEICKNCIHVFTISEKYRKLKLENSIPLPRWEGKGEGDSREFSTPTLILPHQGGGSNTVKITPAPKPITRAAVLGAGVMGGGIAQALSAQDIGVRLKDINYTAIAKGLQVASTIYKDSVKKKRLTKAQASRKMAKINFTLDYSGFKNLDIVIEAVVEDLSLKKNVFKELSEVTPLKTILATNTSALSVTEMAKETKDPSRVIGIHFFNPVHRMPLVEIITTPLTSKETIVTTLEFVKRLGKTPILVNDSCGFVVNRILLGYINEAGRILEECGQLKPIDSLMTSFGMPMGPFLLSDEVGLDVGIKVLHILENGLGERFKPTVFFEKVHEKKFFGKKTRKGFYTHLPNKQKTINTEALRLLPSPQTKNFQSNEYLKRMVYLMINEAAQCLQESIVSDPAAIDVGMIFGTGFPAFRGGLLKYADSLGLGNIVNDLKYFQEKLKADRFGPCPYLLRLAENKKRFYALP